MTVMYGLPKGFDASRFVGGVLEHVSFSVNTLHLTFNDEVSITVESCFNHSLHGSTDQSERAYVPVRESKLMQLIGVSVESAEGSPDGTLTLRFTNGQAFTCYDDTPQYEAYRMYFGKEEIIV